MKLLSYLHDGQPGFGALKGDSVIHLANRLEPGVTSLKSLIAADLVEAAHAYIQHREADVALSDVTLLPPIDAPEKIICVGVNYGKRNEEYKDGSLPPAYPSVFPRFPGSLVAHGQPLKRPPESVQLDYEGEIAIVIGKGGRRIKESDAHKHIAGLTCLNEGTIRDWIKHGKFNVTQGKNFDESGSIGPWMVTADEFNDFENLTVTTRVNGEVRQHDTTKNLMFSFAHLIHYISIWTHLKPGDIISTGTPIGAGVRFDPPRFLSPGDVVEVEVSGIGVLRNGVQDAET